MEQVFEQWKDIAGYEGIYQVSSLGKVRSLDRKVRTCHNSFRTSKGRLLAQRFQKNGYAVVSLYKNGKANTCRVHRLVASAFVGNPFGYDEVNHIDENKRNNSSNNLEWCTRSYNCSYGSGLSKRAKKCSKPCIQYKDGVEVARFPSIIEASRKTGINFANIQRCVSGKSKTAHGFTWSLA